MVVSKTSFCTVTTKANVFMFAAIMAAGCSGSDQQHVIDQSQSAYRGLSASLGKAWDSLNNQARKLDAQSSRTDLEKMKSQMSLFADKAEQTSKQQAEAARYQWQRLDLAERVQGLQKDSEAKLKEMNDARVNATKDLAATNKAYEETEQKLKEAQEAYDTAAKRAEAAWNAATGNS
jgi:hypothetical protein